MPTQPIAALFVSGRSIYHHLENVTAYDSRRDARRFAGPEPIVAHPPCRCWSKYMAHQTRCDNPTAEKALAFFALKKVRRNGGVLEQPAESLFWSAANLPLPNQPADSFGFSLYIEQSWFGYAQKKATWLYIVGVPRSSIPPVPFRLVKPHAHILGLSHAARSRTMPTLAHWLCQIARLAHANQPGTFSR